MMELYDTDALLHAAEALAGMLRALEGQQGMAEAEVAAREREHDDIMHRMEMPDCLYAERARLATCLGRLQRERRRVKDWMAIAKPLLAIAGGEDYKRLQKRLEVLIDAARRVAQEKRRREEAAKAACLAAQTGHGAGEV